MGGGPERVGRREGLGLWLQADLTLSLRECLKMLFLRSRAVSIIDDYEGVM